MTEQEKLTIRILRDYERRKFVGETFTAHDLLDLIPCSDGCIKRGLTGAELKVAVREGAISVVGEKEIDLEVPTKRRIKLKNGDILIKTTWEKAKVNIYKANYTVGEYKMKLIKEIMAE